MKSHLFLAALAAFFLVTFSMEHDLHAAHKAVAAGEKAEAIREHKAELASHETVIEVKLAQAGKLMRYSALRTVAAIAEFFSSRAEAAPATLNANSYLHYSDKNYDVTGVNSDWVALPGQPIRTFHRICIQDTSGKTIALGQGISPSITTQFVIPPTVGASGVPVCYPFGLTFLGTAYSLWIKVLHGGRAVSGESVINFLY